MKVTLSTCAKILVVIDPQVEDYQSLAAGVISDATVLILEPDQDGIQQISTALKNLSNVSRIHIIAHGSPGCINLGNTQLSLDTIKDYTQELQSWFSGITKPQLLIYGSNVATGYPVKKFTETLQALTGAGIVDKNLAFNTEFNRSVSELLLQLGSAQKSSIADNRDLIIDQVSETVISNKEEVLRKEIVFISKNVYDYEYFASNLNPSLQVILIDDQSDGMHQIAAALQGKTEIDAIHLISHGSSGLLDLGASRLDLESIDGIYADELQTIRNALAENADFLVYGCDVASGDIGKKFIQALSVATGADVAASIDATGSVNLGGDWDLEQTVGSIEANSIVSESYQHLLAPLVVTPLGTAGVTSTTLANAILGSGTTLVNASIIGSSSQVGSFSGATGFTPEWLSFSSGVVFSTGNVSNLVGTTNTADNTSANVASSTDNVAVFNTVGGGASFDVSYIDITFVPTNSFLTLQFVFGSEEYNEYVYAAVNDAIGVWVNGTNVAVTPSGSPISIDTINRAGTFNPVQGSQANDPNPSNGIFDSASPSLYVNNDPGLNAGESGTSATFPTRMDGFTRTLSATVAVNSGVNNTIRIGIADIGDAAFDSWLLVSGDSAQTNTIALNDAATTGLNVPRAINVKANDFDVDGDTQTIVTVVDQAITAGGSAVALVSGATVKLNLDGTLTYTPPTGSTSPDIFTYTVSDGTGNTATAYVSITIDNIFPTVAITLSDSALIAGETSTVTFTFSEAPTGFTVADITAENGTISGFAATANPLVYTATFTPTTDIEDPTNVISVGTGYTDAAGNTGTAASSSNYTVDTKSPTVAITLSDSALIAGETSTVTFTFSEAPTGFTVADITAENGTISGFAATANPLVYTATFTPTTDIEDPTNVISVGTGYTDAAGNTGTAGTSANYTIDTLRPTVAITLSDSALIAGETSTVTFTFSEAPTGFTVADITAENGTISGFAATANPLIYTATFTPTTDIEDSTNVISVGTGYTDAAGNTGTAGTSGNYTIDTLRPTVAITLSDSALIAGETSTVTFTFSEAPTGFTVADITAENGLVDAEKWVKASQGAEGAKGTGLE
jgi:large repetitive protein